MRCQGYFLKNFSGNEVVQKQYLLGRLFSRNAKKTHHDQSALQVFSLCLKRNDSQTFKSSRCKKLFLQCACCRYKLLRWMFFISLDNQKSLFFVKVCRYLEIFSAAILQLSLKQVFWKKSLFYVISIISVLIPKFQSKAIVHFTW